MTEREQQVLALIRDDPLISQRAIAERLGISRSAVAGHIMNLSAKGIVKGRGYVVSDTPFVAVVGGANMDIHGAPNATLRLSDSNPGTVQTSPGGVARNIAENLARLGADARLIAPIGDDQYGQLLLQHGRAAGIDMRHVVTIETAQTSTYLSVLDETGDMHVAISDMAILDALDAERLRMHESMLKQASIIVIDTNLNEEALAYLTGTYAGQAIFVDTVSTTKAMRIRPYLGAVHTLKPSLIEAEALAGFEVRSDAGLESLADWFHERGVQRLFVTLGARGVFFSAGGKHGIEALGASTEEMQNAGGAGDAFVAGLAYSWLQDWPLQKSVRFGMAAARVTLSHAGTMSPRMSLATVNRIYGNHYAE